MPFSCCCFVNGVSGCRSDNVNIFVVDNRVGSWLLVLSLPGWFVLFTTFPYPLLLMLVEVFHGFSASSQWCCWMWDVLPAVVTFSHHEVSVAVMGSTIVPPLVWQHPVPVKSGWREILEDFLSLNLYFFMRHTFYVQLSGFLSRPETEVSQVIIVYGFRRQLTADGGRGFLLWLSSSREATF